MDTPPAAYARDPLGPDFAQLALPQPPDYEGPVRAVLVRHRAGPPGPRAVLYVHGFNDYFFQREMAAAYANHGWAFYALDLRKYGRALLPHQHPNNVRDLAEYFADLDAALAQLRAENRREVVLSGHSTGGLLAALYAARWPEAGLAALVLNSPFLALPQPWPLRQASKVAAALGGAWPDLPLPRTLPEAYGQSLHRAYHGHWDYDLGWKPNRVFDINAGWLRAIRRGQAQVRRGLGLALPVLVLHSAHSVHGKRWREAFQHADSVLNVSHIRELAPRLGPRTTVLALEGALHDVVLSEPAVRAAAYERLFAWLEQVLG